jgi:hypothetical protein
MVMSKRVFIKGQIKSGELWAEKGFRIGSTYSVTKEVLNLKVGTIFTFYGFGHVRFDSNDVVCIQVDGASEPETYFISYEKKIKAQLKSSVRALDVLGKIKFKFWSFD